LHAPEPDEVNDSGFVAQGTDEAFGLAFAEGFQSAQHTAELHGFALVVQVSNAVKFGPVNVSKGEMEQQIPASENAKLGLERVGALRAYTFEVFYVGIEVGQGNDSIVSIDWIV
jgi:hypothetical protein